MVRRHGHGPFGIMISAIRVATLLLAGVAITGCGKTGEQDRVEYTKADGKRTADAKSLENGAAAFKVIEGRTVPAEAEKLHLQARAKGESGDYASALVLLRRASEIAPDWAYPYYDMAFTYLLQGDETNALLNYRAVDRLEPLGFFTTKTALWTLDREGKGIFPHGTYLAFVSLEWSEPGKRKALVDRMTTGLPAFAPAWKEKALLTEGKVERLAAFEKALSLDPDAETYGICTLNKAALLNSSGRTVEAKQMVEELISTNTSTRATKALGKEVLKTFAK